MLYDTLCLSSSDEDLKKAAILLQNGKVVAIPTETVYGLAGNAFDEGAVEDIFKAKGRPSDNPLIVHISDFDMIRNIAVDIPPIAISLANKFWPGPLTMVLKKSDNIPSITSGGLDTVGVRMPESVVARKIIELCGNPLAAPSANLSGSPSPTTFNHVRDDMMGRIPAIVDGGDCSVGIESTVVAFDGDSVRILRPGYISLEDILTVTDKVEIDKAVLEGITDGEIVASPGMKYKHYSPKAKVLLIESDFESFSEFATENNKDGLYLLVFDEDVKRLELPCISYGGTDKEQAKELFAKLRELDNLGAEIVYARAPKKNGVGLAVYNRLIRAAGFEVITIE